MPKGWPKDYEFLKKSDESIQWFCKGCTGASCKMYKMLSLVNKRQDQLESDMKSLSNSVAECYSKIDTQSVSVKAIQSEVHGLKENLPRLITKTLNDKHEEEVRENNLLVFNVHEQKGGNRKDKDTGL